jgi:carboxyl-terminal processing protease
MPSLDPYTYTLMNKILCFKINNTGEYTGIGAVISQKELLLERSVQKLPADKAGLKPGDLITK